MPDADSFIKKTGGFIEAIPAGVVSEKCGFNVFGPLPRSNKGNQYMNVETKAVSAQRVVAIAIFLLNQVILKHGASRTLVTDQHGLLGSSYVRFSTLIPPRITQLVMGIPKGSTVYNCSR